MTKVRASDGVVLSSYYAFEPFVVAWDGASVWVINEIGELNRRSRGQENIRYSVCRVVSFRQMEYSPDPESPCTTTPSSPVSSVRFPIAFWRIVEGEKKL